MARQESRSVHRKGDAIFVKEGGPVHFCFHNSVMQGRARITEDVERHGGIIVRNERDADVLLVDEEQDLQLLRTRYYSSKDPHRRSMFVEPRGFVQFCIRAGLYRHFEPMKRGMPGRAPGARPGRPRVPFTEEDRNNLAHYLATRYPTRDGRMGNKGYQELMALAQSDDTEFQWAKRHTFHSWREHYKLNCDAMDARIDVFRRYLRNEGGHHYGQESRQHNVRRDVRPMRQEDGDGDDAEDEDEDDEDEDEDDEDDEDSRDGQSLGGGRGPERRERSATATGRRSGQAARNPLERHGPRHVSSEVEHDSGDDVQIVDPPSDSGKRHYAHHQDTRAKRARVSAESSSGTRAREEPHDESDPEESQSLEGSDLFGDRSYELNSLGLEHPKPLSLRTSPVHEWDAPPPSTQATMVAPPLTTQATLVASPPSAAKAATQAPTPAQAAPSKSPQTVAVAQERIIMQRARVRGAVAQLAPQDTRAQASALEDGPYRNTRARSRSVEPQSQPSKLPRQRKNRGSKGKEEKVPPSIAEDMEPGKEQAAEDADSNEPLPETGGLPSRGTLEDEMSVEGLLENTPEAGTEKNGVHSDSDVDDGSMMGRLPRYQDVNADEPSDSDDAEVHTSLTRGAELEKSTDGGGGPTNAPLEIVSGSEDESEDEDEDEEAERIRRMATGSFHAGPPAPSQARVTRSRAAAENRVQPQVSPRRTRSGNQARAVPALATFLSPGTRAREVVNRVRKEEQRMLYMPPDGTRAARVLKGRRG